MENEILDSSVIEGTSGNDRLEGTDQDDTFFVGRGNDVIDGGEGQDVLNVDGDVIEWTFTTSQDGSIIMTHPTWGQNFLSNVESIFFARSGETLTIEDAISATEGLPAQRIDDDNVLNGTNLDDVIVDTADVVGLYGGVGNDSYQGDPNSFSQVNYDGNRSEYTITENTDGSLSVLHPIWGADRLTDIDALIFTGREPGVNGAVTGEFEFLSVSDIVFDEDIAGDTSTSATLEIGDSVTSDLFGEGDTDFFAIEVEAGQTIRLSQDISDIILDPDSAADANTFRLEDADGNILASGPRSNFGSSPEDFFYTADETGTFFIRMESGAVAAPRGSSFFGEGEYTITATEVIDDHGDTIADATQIISGQSVEAVIDTPRDSDVFTLNIGEGDTVNLLLSTNLIDGTDGLTGTAITITDPNGNQISRDGLFGTGTSLEVDFAATIAGEYAIEIEGTSNAALTNVGEYGEYQLTANIDSGDDNPDTGIADGVTLVGGAGNDDLRGDSGDDILSGEAGNDYLVGGAGADRFILAAIEPGTFSHDTIADFEAGVDVIDVSALTQIASFDDLNIVANHSGTVSIYISETQSLTLNNLTDPSQLDESSFRFVGDEVEDNDTVNTLNGTSSSDIINGTSGDDEIFGFESNDRLAGLNGDDVIFGGSGDDQIIGDQGQDNLFGESGSDLIFGGDGNDLLFGAGGDDTLFDGSGNDIIDGGTGADRLSTGGAGNDVLVGGEGADTFVLSEAFIGENNHDTIIDFETGVDVIDARTIENISSIEDLNIVTNSQGNVSIYLSESNSVTFTNLSDPSDLSASDFLFEGNEEVVVDEGNIIEGTAGEDFLIGGAEIDLIDGGFGNDLLVGGAGDDTFIFTDDFGYDTISDFGNGNDVIDLSSTDFEDFNDLNLVEKDGSVFIYVNENNSIEITNIDSIDELSADDFVF